MVLVTLSLEEKIRMLRPLICLLFMAARVRAGEYICLFVYFYGSKGKGRRVYLSGQKYGQITSSEKIR